MSAAAWNRKLHRWGALLTAIPLLCIIATGVILQLKKDSTWVQPSTTKGSPFELSISFDQILEEAKKVEEAGIQSWKDVDRLDVRPNKGIIKIRSKNRWEVQLDSKTGQQTQVAYRRSDLFEQIHDGSWFDEQIQLGVFTFKLWIFFPTALILLGLWVTGVYLWWLPHGVRRRKRKARAAQGVSR